MQHHADDVANLLQAAPLHVDLMLTHTASSLTDCTPAAALLCSAATVCMPGTWHSCVSGSCTCLPCDKGMFCPGGWRQAKNYAPEDQKGQRLSCEQATVVGAASSINTTTIRANGLTTKSSGAKRPQDCVPMPGFYLASTGRNSQKAALCPNSTYSPGYGRIRQCLKCQSGTEEKPGAGYASDPATVTSPSQLRTNRTDVCREYHCCCFVPALIASSCCMHGRAAVAPTKISALHQVKLNDPS